MQSEQQQRIMGYFIEEAKDHLNTLEQGLLNLQSTMEDSEMVNEVFRAAHSVKGGAAMLGIDSIQKTAHRLEDCFKVLQESPVQADQKLESLFLSVFDTLQSLVEQLQSPFGLTDESAEEIMVDAEPVFEELNTHLESLVKAERESSAAPEPAIAHREVADTRESTSYVPLAANAQFDRRETETMLPATFKREILIRLREMLQLFKQDDTPGHRAALREHCDSLVNLGEEVDLPGWSELISTAKAAIANPQNPYRLLASLVIKDIKQAQELVSAGRAVEVAPSEELKALAPDRAIATDYRDSERTEAWEELEHQNATPDIREPEPNLLFTPTPEPQIPTRDTDIPFRSARSASQPADLSDPEVGMAELNSLADIFEGQTPDLDRTWDEEEIISSDDESSDGEDALSWDDQSDFSDLLGDTDSSDFSELDASTSDDAIGFLGDDSSEEIAVDIQQPTDLPLWGNDPQATDDFSDLLLDTDSIEPQVAETPSADDLNSLFGDSLLEEDASVADNLEAETGLDSTQPDSELFDLSLGDEFDESDAPSTNPFDFTEASDGDMDDLFDTEASSTAETSPSAAFDFPLEDFDNWNDSPTAQRLDREFLQQPAADFEFDSFDDFLETDADTTDLSANDSAIDFEDFSTFETLPEVTSMQASTIPEEALDEQQFDLGATEAGGDDFSESLFVTDDDAFFDLEAAETPQTNESAAMANSSASGLEALFGDEALEETQESAELPSLNVEDFTTDEDWLMGEAESPTPEPAAAFDLFETEETPQSTEDLDNLFGGEVTEETSESIELPSLDVEDFTADNWLMGEAESPTPDTSTPATEAFDLFGEETLEEPQESAELPSLDDEDFTADNWLMGEAESPTPDTSTPATEAFDLFGEETLEEPQESAELPSLDDEDFTADNWLMDEAESPTPDTSTPATEAFDLFGEETLEEPQESAELPSLDDEDFTADNWLMDEAESPTPDTSTPATEAFDLFGEETLEEPQESAELPSLDDEDFTADNWLMGEAESPTPDTSTPATEAFDLFGEETLEEPQESAELPSLDDEDFTADNWLMDEAESPTPDTSTPATEAFDLFGEETLEEPQESAELPSLDDEDFTADNWLMDEAESPTPDASTPATEAFDLFGEETLEEPQESAELPSLDDEDFTADNWLMGEAESPTPDTSTPATEAFDLFGEETLEEPQESAELPSLDDEDFTADNWLMGEAELPTPDAATAAFDLFETEETPQSTGDLEDLFGEETLEEPQESAELPSLDDEDFTADNWLMDEAESPTPDAVIPATEAFDLFGDEALEEPQENAELSSLEVEDFTTDEDWLMGEAELPTPDAATAAFDLFETEETLQPTGDLDDLFGDEIPEETLESVELSSLNVEDFAADDWLMEPAEVSAAPEEIASEAELFDLLETDEAAQLTENAAMPSLPASDLGALLGEEVPAEAEAIAAWEDNLLNLEIAPDSQLEFTDTQARDAEDLEDFLGAGVEDTLDEQDWDEVLQQAAQESAESLWNVEAEGDETASALSDWELEDSSPLFDFPTLSEESALSSPPAAETEPAAERASIDAWAGLDELLEESESVSVPREEPEHLTASEFEALDAFLTEETTPTATSEEDLDAFLTEETIPTAASQLDSFADLESLLAEEAVPTAATTSTDVDFSDLDALLEEQTSVAAPSPAPTAAAAEDDFGDLEKLLEQAEQTAGTPAAAIAKPRQMGITPIQKRPSRIIEQTMRVSVKQLDSLSNLVGELVVNRNSLEQDQERLRQFLDNLQHQVLALSDVGARMQDLYERSLLESSLLASRHGSRPHFLESSRDNVHASGVEYDPLEMDRFTGFHLLSQEMIELIVRVRESASDIEFLVDETDQVARMLRQITTQLQEGLTRSRMVPFAHTADRLPRAVREISLKLSKQAQLQVEGRETLIDKMILENLYDPMTHLVNNAITHGIESPEERKAAGKSPIGQITLKAFHQGNQTVISISDDGAGIDPDRIRKKAIQQRLITPAEAKRLTPLELYDFLFHPGFSTKDKADDFSGRGVGMDVVRTCLFEIRGAIHIDSEVGQGTTFTIRLPLTLSICKALCCVSDRAHIAFPMDGVEDALDVSGDRVQRNAEGQTYIQWRDTVLPFQPLNDLLTYNRQISRGTVYGGKREDDIVSIIVLRSAGNFLAVQVDRVLGEQEIVIKQLEGPPPKPVGIAGATVLGDGRIMAIADVLELIDLSMGRIRKDGGVSIWQSLEEPQLPAAPEVPEPPSEPMVLIVDDSITVRELLSMTFTKAGYRVEQARDGQEAWDKLRSGLPCDVVFCDIEMPRMDGLELLSRLQKDENLSHLPIAMLTSRGADRHRQMAAQLGARGYFTKPYLEEVLLDAAQRIIKGEVLMNAPANG